MTETMSEVQATIERAKDALTVRRVFGDPYEKDGVTVIPAARVRGGAGGGIGEGPDGEGKGSGSGFGVSARPSGAFVIKDAKVRWQPVIEPGKVLVAAVLVLLALFGARTIVKGRAIRA
jgi:uncharacterized spore protein YtfJ